MAVVPANQEILQNKHSFLGVSTLVRVRSLISSRGLLDLINIVIEEGRFKARLVQRILPGGDCRSVSRTRKQYSRMGCGASSTKVHQGPACHLEETYMVTDQLDSQGEGSLFSAVHRATGKNAVVKVISRKRKDDAFNEDGASHEAEILRKLRHPHCVSLVE
eukprot:1487826-Rhodomonas_salina.1